MGPLTLLQDAALEARKSKTPHAAYLALILSNAQMTAKAEQRLLNDADAESAIRAEIKSLTTLVDGDEGKGVQALPAGPYRDQAAERRDLLKAFVPGLLEGVELADAIRDAAVEADVVISPQAMGKIMGVLKAKYGTRVDGKLVKAALAAGV